VVPDGSPQLDRLHRQVSTLVIGLVLVHAVSTAFDAMGNNWLTVLVPGDIGRQGWPAAVWGFNAGIFATYALLLVAPTFYLRRAVGIRRWRFLHRFVLVFYVLSVWHTLILGLDVAYYPVLRPLIWLAQIPLLALLIRWVASPLRSDGKRGDPATRRTLACVRYLVVNASAAVMVAIVFLVVTGHSGFIQTL
jgi:predicted ferric reductase